MYTGVHAHQCGGGARARSRRRVPLADNDTVRLVRTAMVLKMYGSVVESIQAEHVYLPVAMLRQPHRRHAAAAACDAAGKAARLLGRYGEHLGIVACGRANPEAAAHCGQRASERRNQLVEPQLARFLCPQSLGSVTLEAYAEGFAASVLAEADAMLDHEPAQSFARRPGRNCQIATALDALDRLRRELRPGSLLAHTSVEDGQDAPD